MHNFIIAFDFKDTPDGGSHCSTDVPSSGPGARSVAHVAASEREALAGLLTDYASMIRNGAIPLQELRSHAFMVRGAAE